MQNKYIWKIFIFILAVCSAGAGLCAGSPGTRGVSSLFPTARYGRVQLAPFCSLTFCSISNIFSTFWLFNISHTLIFVNAGLIYLERSLEFMIIGAHALLFCPCDTADQAPSRVGCPSLLYGQPNINFIQSSKQASTAALCCILINFVFFGDDKCREEGIFMNERCSRCIWKRNVVLAWGSANLLLSGPKQLSAERNQWYYCQPLHVSVTSLLSFPAFLVVLCPGVCSGRWRKWVNIPGSQEAPRNCWRMLPGVWERNALLSALTRAEVISEERKGSRQR